MAYKTDVGCLDCTNGQFSENLDSENCIQCPRGYYGKTSNKVSCQECTRGKYGDQLESKTETEEIKSEKVKN